MIAFWVSLSVHHFLSLPSWFYSFSHQFEQLSRTYCYGLKMVSVPQGCMWLRSWPRVTLLENGEPFGRWDSLWGFEAACMKPLSSLKGVVIKRASWPSPSCPWLLYDRTTGPYIQRCHDGLHPWASSEHRSVGLPDLGFWISKTVH